MEFAAEREFVASRFKEELTATASGSVQVCSTPMEIGARRLCLCPSDKARLLIALIVAKELPQDHTPLSYVLKLRDVFPISTGTFDPDDRLVERIKDLEQRLALARADEAHAKLELLTYRARYPPVACESEVVASGGGGVKRPGSPSNSSKKPPKKKKKQADTDIQDKVWFEERLGQLDAALEVIQTSFDPGTYLKSAGLVASLLRLRGAPVSAVHPTVAPLLQRCLIDASSLVKDVCANPTAQTSLDSLNAIQTLLPELLLVIQTRAARPVVDTDEAELSRILAHDVIEPILRGFHPASTALASRTSGATRSRTRRGKLKSGARATRQAEEELGGGKPLVDIRPGLLNVVCLVAKSKAMRGGGMLYAVLPIACHLVRELTPSRHRPSAPGSGAVRRLQSFAAADSLWYLSSACHAMLEHTAPFAQDDTKLLSHCSEMLVAVLTKEGEARTDGPVQEMLCALLERIMLSFPS